MFSGVVKRVVRSQLLSLTWLQNFFYNILKLALLSFTRLYQEPDAFAVAENGR